jgi:signal transduction histidine kinase
MGRHGARAIRDAVGAAVVIASGGALFVAFDVVERIAPPIRRWEAAQLDDLLLTLALAVVVLAWFAIRRWRESVRQLAALRQAEAENLAHLRRLEALSSQLLDTEERERLRLSEALHDGVGQTLFACQLQLAPLAQHMTDPRGQQQLGEAQQLVAAALKHARDLTVDLSPPILHDLGLAEAIVWWLQRVESRYGVRARLAPGEAWSEVPALWHAAVFHSVQELVINAGKHAQASSIEVRVQREAGEGLSIEVIDDGRGFDRALAVDGGFGLFSIERRMACIAGRLDIRAAVSGGTVASLRFPSA